MSNADIRGRFIWHELMTTDPEAAGAFYSKVVPWKTQPSGMPSYTLWMAGKSQTGGLMALPQEGQDTGTPPHWLVYIGTPDVDATVEAAQRLGGKVLKEPADIPNIGRFAVLSDPQGATFAVYTPAAEAPDSPPSDAAGEFSWHELATTDLDGAVQFYTELFGWAKGPGNDMGPMGIYQLFEHGGAQVGGMYKVPAPSTGPHWLSYVRVKDADKAASAAKAAGGKVLNGPMEVPGGSWIVQIVDPQGGAFAVHEPAKAKSQAAPKKRAAAKSAAETTRTEAVPEEPAPADDSAAAEEAAAAKPARRKKAAGKKKAAAKKAGGRKAAPAKRKSAGKKAAAKKKAPAGKRGKPAMKAKAPMKAKAKMKAPGKGPGKSKAPAKAQAKGKAKGKKRR